MSCPMKWPSAKVAGLPMSWTSAASRTTGRATGAASTDRRVWSHRSSPATLFWGMPRCDASSGEMPASSPVSPSRRSPIDGRSAASSFSSSVAIRSPERWIDEIGLLPDPGQRRGLHPELERRGQADRPDHPERVLLETEQGVADGAQDAGADVGETRVRIDEPGRLRGLGARPPGHRVTGEVAARQVELDRVAELDPMRATEVGVVVVGAERRDLEDLAVAADRHGPELVLVHRVRQERQDALGQGVRGQVPVRGGDARARCRAESHRPRMRRDRPPRASRAGRARAPGWPPGSSASRVAVVSSDPGTGTSAMPRCSRRPRYGVNSE